MTLIRSRNRHLCIWRARQKHLVARLEICVRRRFQRRVSTTTQQQAQENKRKSACTHLYPLAPRRHRISRRPLLTEKMPSGVVAKRLVPAILGDLLHKGHECTRCGATCLPRRDSADRSCAAFTGNPICRAAGESAVAGRTGLVAWSGSKPRSEKITMPDDLLPSFAPPSSHTAIAAHSEQRRGGHDDVREYGDERA